MKKPQLKSILIISAALALAACNGNSTMNTNTDSSATTSTVSADTSHMNSNMMSSVDESSKDFMMEAAKGGMMEVSLGNSAMQKASGQNVKDFGKMMVDDHSKANQNLKDLAANKNVTLPTAVSDDQQKEMDNLMKKSGKDFDKAYVHMMVDDHKKDIAEFKNAANKAEDADVKNFISATLPTLQKHLNAIEAIEKKM